MKKKDSPGIVKGNISVSGKTFPCRVTMGAMIRFKNKAGYDVSQLDTSDIEGLTLFLWCCVAAACSADKVNFEMSFEEFADSLEPSSLNDFYDTMSPTGEKKTVSQSPLPT